MLKTEAAAIFMNENNPKFVDERLSFPVQVVDYGLST